MFFQLFKSAEESENIFRRERLWILQVIFSGIPSRVAGYKEDDPNYDARDSHVMEEEGLKLLRGKFVMFTITAYADSSLVELQTQILIGNSGKDDNCLSGVCVVGRCVARKIIGFASKYNMCRGCNSF